MGLYSVAVRLDATTDSAVAPGLPAAEQAAAPLSPGVLRQRLRADAWQRAVSSGVLLVPVLGALVVSFCVTPAAIESGLMLSPPCTFKTVFGVPCLSCGMTRAFAALSHGQLALAWSYNRLSPFMYGLFWGLASWGGWHLARALRDWLRLGRGP
jgi:hypothetical protein